MLNKELSHFSESKSGNQISEYICNTFLGTYDVSLHILELSTGTVEEKSKKMGRDFQNQE